MSSWGLINNKQWIYNLYVIKRGTLYIEHCHLCMRGHLKVRLESHYVIFSLINFKIETVQTCHRFMLCSDLFFFIVDSLYIQTWDRIIRSTQTWIFHRLQINIFLYQILNFFQQTKFMPVMIVNKPEESRR